MIYLDNSATSYPKPLAVRQAVAKALTEYGANPGRSGYAMSVRTTQAVYECRQAAAEFFGARGPQCVIFTPSCTQSINMVLHGMLRPGDHVVVSDMEHNAVMRPLAALGEKGIAYTAAAMTPGDSDATLEAFRRAMRPNTRLVVCTQASNVFGIRVPVERIAALCHQYGAKICVDCAQSAGLVPIHMEESGIDYLCCAGHKGLYGLMGTGLLILRDPEEPLEPLIRGGTGSQSRSLVQPDDPPERYESGTVNVPGILALRAGIDFVRRRGPENLWREETAKAAQLYDRLARMPQVQLYTGRPQLPDSLPVLSFNIRGMDSEAVGEALARHGIAVRSGLHCAPTAHEKMGDGGAVRVSPGVFTTEREIETAAAVIRALRPGG